MRISRENSTEVEKVNEAVKEIKSAALKEEKKTPVEFISSNSTLLNLAISGKGKEGGWPRGRISNVVGDGSSGKTLLALEFAAYVFYNMVGNVSQNFSVVKKIKIVYDNAEEVMDFPVAEMYGQDFFDSVEWISSKTVQAWGRNIGREILANKPGELLLYITDSLDALGSEEGEERFIEAAKKDKPEEGAYNLEKASYLSKSFFQNICSLIAGKDITLFIISQVRTKIGIVFGEKHRRAGGDALNFYTHVVPWLAEIEKLKKKFRGEERSYGIRTKAKIKRNKVGKPFREAELIILFDYGVDDIGSNLAYLYGPDVKVLNWEGIDYNRNDLIAHIENNKLQEELAKRVEKAWSEIEDAIRPNRIKRY